MTVANVSGQKPIWIFPPAVDVPEQIRHGSDEEEEDQEQEERQEPSPAAVPKLPPPGGIFRFKGQTIRMPLTWPAEPQKTEVCSRNLTDIVRDVMGADCLNAWTPRHQGRYLKLKNHVGLAEEGKLICLQVLASVQALEKEDPEAYQDVSVMWQSVRPCVDV